eukprot:6181562-Pleurochrysis_carterae.AAC.5
MALCSVLRTSLTMARLKLSWSAVERSGRTWCTMVAGGTISVNTLFARGSFGGLYSLEPW